MALFPPSFLEDLKTQTDIISVIGDVVPLKKTGGTWKGLCPFHQEKTPSFNVNGDKGFFKCFGCGAGGDVVKFVELTQKVSFPEAVRYLANRAGMPVPEASGAPADREAAAEREAIVGLHETAAAFYREMLAGAAGARARKELEKRGLTAETQATFGYGYAPAGGRDTLNGRFNDQKVPVALQTKSGLVVVREDGRVVDRFRNRLMIPIARDSGAIVAFGGRALDPGQVPKYLNSPETPVYSKGRTLYGLHVTRGAIRKHNYAVLVEGYFDLAQVWQSGVQAVVASCGTALTPQQARLLKRFTAKVVLSFDPDAAGQGAAARSSELLVTEGFQVNVALLPAGADPDTFIQTHGGRAYVERLTGSRPYLDFLLDRAAAGLDLKRPDHRKTFLEKMLVVASTIPDAADRDQFADRLAHKSGVTDSVIRDEIKRAAGARKKEVPAVAVAASVRLKTAEHGLIWLLVHRPVEGLAAISQLDDADLEGLLSASVIRTATGLADMPADVFPSLLRERLTEGERALVDRAADLEAAPASPAGCVAALRRERYVRERALLQQEIGRISGSDPRLTELLQQKREIVQKIEELTENDKETGFVH